MTSQTIHAVEIEGDAVVEALALVDQVCAAHQSVEDDAFQSEAALYAQELPRSLRKGLIEFRLREPASLCVVRGFPVDDAALGPTPSHWRYRPAASPTAREEVFFYLCASLLGDPVAWATKQDGTIMHNVVPIAGQETEQLASSSRTALTWHTEDSFHPFRADYLGLMCLRNPDEVETTVATVDDLDLSEEITALLHEPRYRIVPDGSHLDTAGAVTRDDVPEHLLRRSRDRIRQMCDDPESIPLLYGDIDQPYLRLDQFFCSTLPDDDAAEKALRTVIEHTSERIWGYALRPGEICFLDNYKAVHGRQPFRARYDGTDRWLKRLNVVRDLRKSREARAHAASRVIV